MTDRKKPTAGFWITAALVAELVAYPLSFGPACWIASHMDREDSTIETACHPIIWAWDFLPKPIQSVLGWYSRWGAAEGWGWIGGGYINWRDPHLQMQFRWGNARRPISH